MPTIEQLETLLSSEPNDVFLNFGLAMQYAQAGRVADAVRQFARVVELDPKHAAAYFQWGKTLIAAGRHAEAREVLLRGTGAAAAAGDNHALDKMNALIQAIPPVAE
jgi:predicted Zn-dependent protease